MVNNYVRNVESSFNSIKTLPPRINWTKRDKVIRLYDKLSELIKREGNKSFNKFKYNHHLGQFKMMKAMDIMAYKYLDATKNNFNIYRKNVA